MRLGVTYPLGERLEIDFFELLDDEKSQVLGIMLKLANFDWLKLFHDIYSLIFPNMLL